MNRLTIQYFKHDLRRENAKYCIGRYVRYTIKAVPHKVFSRFYPSNVETHAKVQCRSCLHGCDCSSDSGRIHCMGEIRAAEYMLSGNKA